MHIYINIFLFIYIYTLSDYKPAADKYMFIDRAEDANIKEDPKISTTVN